MLNNRKWTSDDKILHVLPLHHMHGILNKLCCAMWAGATVEFMKFHPIDMWKKFGDSNSGLTLFMGVPTIYAKVF